MEKDISKTTIIILLVLTVTISIVGTLTVLDSLGEVRAATIKQGGTADNHIAALDHKEDSGTIQLAVRRG